MGLRNQRIRVVLALFVTFALLYFTHSRRLVLVLLAPSWVLFFYPITAAELIAFVVAAVFFMIQNYVCLKAGLFEFRYKDVLLMPWYEPPLWGFYFLGMKRFVSGRGSIGHVVVDKRSVAGLVATSLMFSLFSFDSRALLAATACSTTLLLLLFHTKADLSYGLYALALGFLVELFGVSTDLWSYPAPDFLGIPYWFVTMWISVGLLGRRFLFPAADWLVSSAEG